MALNFAKFWNGIKIKAKSVLSSDSMGEIEVDSASGKVNYHNGVSRSPVVTESHAATLTNKTIDANGTGNSISNLETADLAAGVLNTSTTLTGATNTQIPSALAVKTYVDTGLAAQNEASEITVTPAVNGNTNVQSVLQDHETRVSSNTSTISAHTSASSGVHGVTGSVVGTTDSQTLTNKVLSGNTASNLINSTGTINFNSSGTVTVPNVTGTVVTTGDTGTVTSTMIADGTIVNADINASAAIAKTKLASGTANRVEVTDISGNLVESTVTTTELGLLSGKTGSIVTTNDTGSVTSTMIADGTIVNADINASAAIAKSKLAAGTASRVEVTDGSGNLTESTVTTTELGLLSGKTGSLVTTNDTGSVTSTMIADNTIVNADINSAADIARSKLASGTASTIIANNGSGVMSDISDITVGTNNLTLANTKHIEVQAATDSTTTGSNASLTAFTGGLIRLTNASLVSLANIPAGANGQQLEIVNRTGASVTIVDDASAVGTAANRIYTGSGQNITLANNASLRLDYDSTSARWQIVGGSGGSGTATSAVDNVFNINDATDATKQINFDAGGTTATKTTIAAAQTANRTVTLPDATTTLVGTDVAQTLTNKTIVAANNTITTAASGNLTSTSLNAALAELQGDIDTKAVNPSQLVAQIFDLAALTDFTQTGLSLSTANPIKGTKSALLTHQPATSQSFKQVIAVDRKFRGYNNTLSLVVRSSAASSNLTILVTDETNSATLLASSQITTGQITSAVFNTASSTTVTVTDNSILNQIKIGATITGSGIPANTVVSNVSPTAGTITISNPATATATGVSLKVSVLPSTKTFSFDIPANCASISYTITALQEAGSPESYIDDVQIYLTSQAQSSASVTTNTYNATDWTAISAGASVNWTNTTITNLYYKRDGDSVLYKGKIAITGTPASGQLVLTVPHTLDTTKFSTGIKVSSFVNLYHTGILDYYGILDLNTSNSLSFRYIANASFPLANAAGVTPTAPTTWANGDIFEFETLPIPVVGWTASTTTSTTIPLTSSVLVTQPDSTVRVRTGNGFGSTNTQVRRYVNIDDNIGSSVLYQDSATAGASFTILEAGTYEMSADDLTTTTGSTLGITKNTTTVAAGSNLLAYGTVIGGQSNSISCTVQLTVGDVIRVMCESPGNITAAASVASFKISKVGSTKILNPSSDQKVVIPTHQLRFEGASARGSTDTAIVKFDTQTITQGDGFTVVNTAANGTVITVRKAGILSISTTLYYASAAILTITKNLTSLTTTIPTVASEILAGDGIQGTSEYGSASWTGTVNVGDIIRITSNVTPLAQAANNLTLSLQEQSVAVALQNVTPTYDNSDSTVQLRTANGYGSTNTKIRRFSNTVQNFGTDITYTDDAALGGYFTINKDGEYQISYTDLFNAASTLGITKNSSELTTNVISLTAPSSLLASADTGGVNYCGSASWAGYLLKGDVIRAHTNGTTSGTSGTLEAKFTISRVGKTSGTVDVTPFVQIPQQDVEAIEATGNGFASTSTGVFRFSTRRNTNKGIIQIIDTSTDGTYFKALKDCTVTVTVAGIYATTTANNFSIVKNGSGTILVGAPSTANLLAASTAGVSSRSTISASVNLIAGENIYVNRDNTSVNGNDASSDITILATAQTSSVASSTQQVSSDTMNFVFKSTAIDPNTDAIGTFNTYTYAANTNTATIATTAPTQTTTSMNINGIQIFARAYNATSTAESPARVDIFIGKGLKSKQVDLYANATKTGATNYDFIVANTGAERGTNVSYNETTGILTIDAATSVVTTTDRRLDTLTAITSGYFVFNASKTPSLVTIPSQQKVGARYMGTTGTTLTGTATNVIFNTLDFDSHGFYNTSTGVATIPQDGIYAINAQVEASTSSSSANSGIVLYAYKNGVQIARNYYPFPVGAVTLNASTTISTAFNCKKNDTIEFKIAKDTNVTAVAIATTSTQCYMSITRQGN